MHSDTDTGGFETELWCIAASQQSVGFVAASALLDLV
jgi:hypothetical protein